MYSSVKKKNKMKSDDKMGIKSGKESRYKKLKSYITVEPCLFAIAIPYCLSVIGLDNLILEKVSV